MAFFEKNKLKLLEEENKNLKEENELLRRQLQEIITFIDTQVEHDQKTKLGRKQKFDEHEKIKIQEDYKKIKSLRKIAEKYNTSRTTIQRIIKEKGVTK